MNGVEARIWYSSNSGPDVMIISDERRISCGMQTAGGGVRAIDPVKTIGVPVIQVGRTGKKIASFRDEVEAFVWTGIPAIEIRAAAVSGCLAGGFAWRTA
jgi:hypothetical protein